MVHISRIETGKSVALGGGATVIVVGILIMLIIAVALVGALAHSKVMLAIVSICKFCNTMESCFITRTTLYIYMVKF